MRFLLTLLTVTVIANTAYAGYIVEIDTDGADDGVITWNPNFSFGGDTTIASQSTTSLAFGTTGGDSIFGGDGFNAADTYVYQYSPDSQSDNLLISNGQDLGNGNFATGAVGGGSGLYSVYATWPYTENVTGGLTTFGVSTSGDNFVIQIDQNFLGDEWIYLGDIDYTSGMITVEQMSVSNTFISMRSHGLLFEAVVPEPATALLLLAAGPFVLRRRR